MNKTQENEVVLNKALAEGRDYVLKGELPYPGAIIRFPQVLAISGVKVYLKTKPE